MRMALLPMELLGTTVKKVESITLDSDNTPKVDAKFDASNAKKGATVGKKL